MSTEDIVRYRLANQHISKPSSGTIAELVASFGAIQAQDYEGALWSIGLRTEGCTRRSVEQAIVERQIVRTWPMRGTLHFVAAANIRWMIELMTPRVIAGSAYRQRNLELDNKVFSKSRDIFVKALSGDKQLTRSAMCQLLEDNGISTKGQRGIHIMWRLSQEGVLCFGPHEGKQPTFTLLSDWVPHAKSLPREESLSRMAGLYFTCHGPATIQDFMWWSGLTSADAKAGLETAKDELVSIKSEGREYWLSASSQIQSETSQSAFLLPGFDEYLLGYRDRSSALPAHHSQKIVPGNNGMFLPTIVIHGKVAGLWTRKVKTKRVDITPKLFESITAKEQIKIQESAERYGKFLGLAMQID